MTIRDNVARSFAGGPPFRVLADRIIVEVTDDQSISQLAGGGFDDELGILDENPVSRNRLNSVRNRLESLGFNTKGLDNVGIVVAQADRLDDVLETMADRRGMFSQKAVKRIKNIRQQAINRSEKTSLGLGSFSGMEFGQDEKVSREAKIRNELTNISLQNPVTSALQELEGVFNAELAFSRNTFGPRNLNVDVDNLPNLLEQAAREEDGETPHVGDALEKVGVPQVWEVTRGENAVVAVFDTSFCAEFLDSGRVIDTFSGPDVDSAYSAPEEGHGTMTAYSAAGNKNFSGLDYNGAAPDAGLLLARTTNADGSIVYTEEAWDWLVGHIRNLERPVVSNHSYGVPMCSARAMNLCESTTLKLARTVNKRADHQAFYAAGNEALYCFPPSTQIQTPHGNSNIEDIEVGDMVMSHNGSYYAVEKTFDREFTGDLIEISPYHARDIQLTPNHPVLKRKHGGSVGGKAEWSDAENVSAGDYVAMPRVEKLDNVPEMLEVPEYNYDSNHWKRYEEVTELRKQNGWGPKKIHDKTGVPIGTIQSWIYRNVKPRKLPDVPDKVNNDEDLNALLGYYISEGYANEDSVDFAFHEDEKERMFDLAEKVESVFGLDCEYKDITGNNDKAVHVRVNNVRVAKFFKQYCGSGSENKHMPHWSVHDSKENLKTIIREYYNGDGWNSDPDRYTMSTQSSELAHQLQLSLARFGITSTISESDGGDVSDIDGRQIVRNDIRYRVVVSKQQQASSMMQEVLERDDDITSTRGSHKPHIVDNDYIFVKVKDVSKVSHSGKVYNLRVAETNTYVANNLAVHNCGHRLAGMTNGINGVNSDPTSITVAALRFDLRDAQSYSSHGFGTCSRVNLDPKPDIGFLLPDILPYGCQEKDMSSGRGGSSGGTSEATPLTCGVGALIASVTGNARQDVLEETLQKTAKSVRPTQINLLRGFDARFGAGQVNPVKAIERSQQIASEDESSQTRSRPRRLGEQIEGVSDILGGSVNPSEGIDRI